MLNSLSAFAMFLSLIALAFTIAIGSYLWAIPLLALGYYSSTLIND